MGNLWWSYCFSFSHSFYVPNFPLQLAWSKTLLFNRYHLVNKAKDSFFKKIPEIMLDFCSNSGSPQSGLHFNRVRFMSCHVNWSIYLHRDWLVITVHNQLYGTTYPGSPGNPTRTTLSCIWFVIQATGEALIFDIWSTTIETRILRHINTWSKFLLSCLQVHHPLELHQSYSAKLNI